MMSEPPNEPPPPYPGLPEGYQAPPKQAPYAPNAPNMAAGPMPYYPPPQPAQMQMAPGPPLPATTVVVTTVGDCPNCRAGNMMTETDACAIICIVILAICFFPIGLLYLLCIPCMNERRCPNCGYRTSA